VEPNSGLGQTISYLLKHWEKLTLFLRVAGAPMDKNLVERALKKGHSASQETPCFTKPGKAPDGGSVHEPDPTPARSTMSGTIAIPWHGWLRPPPRNMMNPAWRKGSFSAGRTGTLEMAAKRVFHKSDSQRLFGQPSAECNKRNIEISIAAA
jgi:hypothetical protein